MSNKKSFVLYKDSLQVLNDLSDEQAGKLFKAIKATQLGEDFELDALTKVALSPFKAQFSRDNEKYEMIVERNKNNGLKGGRPKTELNPEKAKEPSGIITNPENPKKADSDSDSDSDSDKSIKHLDQSKIDRDNFINEAFEYWWARWPKKVAKKNTFKAWQKTVKKKSDQEVRDLTNHIVDDVALRMADIEAGGKTYIGFGMLHATTYLNQERYNDDI